MSRAPQVDPHRLPRHTVPSHYRLELTPDLAAGSFAGEVAIDIEVTDETDELVCNAFDLDISNVQLAAAGRKDRALAARVDREHERIHLADGSPIAVGQHTLTMSFTGVFNPKLVGFYRSTFNDESGDEQPIAVTQFESTHARKAFPCWDEPDFKATFGVTLVVDDGLLAVSNAAQVDEERTGDGRRRVRFADTMVMSTYLVAFIVGPLEATQPVDVDGVPVRVIHPPGQGHLTSYSLDVAANALRWFSDYYGIGYPGDKLDLVAVPDFAFGAMENLGCVTFREVLLLVDPEAATRSELERLTDVICHELAHMWFGDLVTMRWWEGIWLNEAFATFMEVSATDAQRPEWRRWDSFGRDRTAAFDVDALATTRSIEFTVESPKDAEAMFDVLTYEKGGAVLRMLEQHLGPQAFRKGIARYLATYAYDNTETTDLWDSLEDATGQPARRIMDSWIFQAGHPRLSLTIGPSGDTLRLAQHVMRYDPADLPDTRWVIPVGLRYRTATGQIIERRMLLDDAEVTITLDPPADPSTVVPNAGSHGFYRVSREAPQLLAHARLAQDWLSPIERYSLVDDAWAQVVAGSLDAATFLGTVECLGPENETAVWSRILGTLGALDRLVEGAAREALRARVRALVRPSFGSLGIEPGPDEDDLTRERRGMLLRALADLGDDAEARAVAAELYGRYRADRTAVDPALATAALGLFAQTVDDEGFVELVERYRQATEPQEELRYLYSLAEPLDRALIDRCCTMALTEVRSQNAPFLLARAMTHRECGPQVWRFVRDHWEEMIERFPTSSIVRMLDGVRSLVDRDTATDVAAFFETHDVPSGEKTLAQHLERLRINVALADRERARLAAALTTR